MAPMRVPIATAALSLFAVPPPTTTLRAFPPTMLLSDPYATLGLAAEATAAEIRKAFRSKARLLHPDVSSDPMAVEQFQELVEAVEALQSGATFSRIAKAPEVETPAGMTSADERVQWLISANKVLLFMRGTKMAPNPKCPDSHAAVQTK